MRQRCVSSVVSVCLAAAWVAPALAQQTTSPATVTITGRVTTRDDAALPRVRVAANDPATNRLLQAVMTDGGGRFTLTLPRDTNAQIIFAKAGYAAYRVRPSGTDLQVRLQRGAAMTGRVTDQYGDPLPARQVVARRIVENGAGDLNAPPLEFSADADDLGEYRIGGLPEGRYTVAPLPASAGRGAPSEAPPTPTSIAVTAGDVVTAVDFAVDVPPASGVPAVVTPSESERSAIHGRVTNSAGRPIVGATVRAMRSGAPIRFGLTDAEGRYVVTAISAGDYRVEAIKTGYTTLQYGQEGVGQLGRVIGVGEGQTVERIDITLPRGSAIAGTVVDEFGEPMQGVMVEVLQVRTVAGRPRALRLRGRATDDRGVYRVFGLLPGTYVVRVQVSETLANSDGEGYAPVFFPGGTAVEQAARLELALGRDAPNTDVVVMPTRALRVTGRAVDSTGRPVTAGVAMVISERSGAIQTEPMQARPNSNGEFEFTNVPPGDYVVQAFAPPQMGANGQATALPEFAAQYVTVSDASPPALFLRTSRGSTLAGRIVIEGQPLSERAAVSLIARPTDFDRAPIVGSGSMGFTLESDMTFRYAGLTGPRQLVLNTAAPGWYLKSAMIGGQDVADTSFDFGLEEATISDVEVVISTAGASIAGRVSDDKANPVSEYSVIVFPTDRAGWYPASRFVKLGRPAQDGGFRIEGLPPGDYWLVAVEQVDTSAAGEWQSPELLEALVARANRTTLGEGEVYDVALRVIRR